MSIKLVTDQRIAETSSKGNQEKWLDPETNHWYKLDQFGYEALAEAFVSLLLEKAIWSGTPPSPSCDIGWRPSTSTDWIEPVVPARIS